MVTTTAQDADCMFRFPVRHNRFNSSQLWRGVAVGQILVVVVLGMPGSGLMTSSGLSSIKVKGYTLKHQDFRHSAQIYAAPRSTFPSPAQSKQKAIVGDPYANSHWEEDKRDSSIIQRSTTCLGGVKLKRLAIYSSTGAPSTVYSIRKCFYGRNAD